MRLRDLLVYTVCGLLLGLTLLGVASLAGCGEPANDAGGRRFSASALDAAPPEEPEPECARPFLCDDPHLERPGCAVEFATRPWGCYAQCEPCR